MTHRRLILLISISIAVGYGFHDIAREIGSKFLYRSHLLPNQTDQSSVLGRNSSDSFMTYIAFDGKDLSPKRVSVKEGNYIVITNKSPDILMWIVSDAPGLSTPRGYAQGEQFQYKAVKAGTYLVRESFSVASAVQLTVLR